MVGVPLITTSPLLVFHAQLLELNNYCPTLALKTAASCTIGWIIVLYRTCHRIAGINFNNNLMNHYIRKTAPLVFAAIIMTASCSESKTNSEEQTEISTIDSTSKAVKENTDKLDEQTKKVEESLEKLDKEFDSTQ